MSKHRPNQSNQVTTKPGSRHITLVNVWTVGLTYCKVFTQLSIVAKKNWSPTIAVENESFFFYIVERFFIFKLRATRTKNSETPTLMTFR